MMLDLARHYNEGPVPIGEIAEVEGISVKYLEQLIIPLKKAKYIKSVRGPKGGHMLSKPPEEISIADIVKVLEGGFGFSPCIEDPAACKRTSDCLTRGLWEETTRAVLDKLDSITLSDMLQRRPIPDQSPWKSEGRETPWTVKPMIRRQ